MATKKAIRNWSIISLFLVVLIYFLMVTGKEHSVFLDNKGGESGIRYSIDGENYQDLGTKKLQRFIQGSSHTLYLKKANGQVIEYEFALGFTENDTEIEIPFVLVGNK